MAYPAETHSGTVTSWIPLTGSYSPPSSCSSIFRLETPSLVAFDPSYGREIDSAVNCQPSAVTTWWNQGLFGGNKADHTAVSILPLTCPQGWSTVATSISGGSSTLAMCCPSQYSLVNREGSSINGNCQSGVSAGQVLTYASTSAANTESWAIRTTTVDTESFVGAIAILGWNVATSTTMSSMTSVASTSSSSLSSTLLPTSSTPTTTTAATSTTSTISTPISASTSPSDSDLSAGAKAGIGVGIGMGVLSLVASMAVFWAIRKRRSSPRTDANPSVFITDPKVNYPTMAKAPPSEMPPSNTYGATELQSTAVSELPHQDRSQGFNGYASPVELPASWR